MVTDKEIWSYYDRNRDSFRQPEQVRASHILIKADPQGDEAKKAEARKKIEEILDEGPAGTGFRLAGAHLFGRPERPKGGDLGYISAGPGDEALRGGPLQPSSRGR